MADPEKVSTDIDEDTYDFGKRIKLLRERKGWTQKILGDKIGVTKEAISHYENNIQLPSIGKIKRLALYLNSSADYILGLENDPVIKISGLTPDKRQFVLDFIKYLVDE